MATEKRLIDANSLCEAVDKSDRENFHKGVANRSIHHYEHIHFMKMVLDAPTVDAVEVVRCKDCEHWHEETAFCEKHSRFDSFGMDWNMFEDDDFCSYGERRTNHV